MFSRILVIFCLFFPVGLFSQNDVIKTTDGEEIHCFITKEDSSKVYFKIGSLQSNVEASIDRNKISSISYSKKEEIQAPVLGMDPKIRQQDVQIVDTTVIPASEPEIPKKNNRSMNSLAINIGMGIPLGAFANNTDTNTVGSANIGQIVGLSFRHINEKGLGVCINGNFSNNELNSASLVNRWNKNTDSVWSANKTNWRAFNINFGVLYNKRVNDFSFNVEGFIGFMTMNYPEVKLSVSSVYYLEYQKVSTDALTLGASGGLSYFILQDVSIDLDFRYQFSNLIYKEVLIHGEEPIGSNSVKLDYTKRNVKVPYQALQTMLGLRVWF